MCSGVGASRGFYKLDIKGVGLARSWEGRTSFLHRYQAEAIQIKLNDFECD